MNIPFNDLKRQYQSIQREIDQSVKRVLSKGIFVLGSEVQLFEEELASYLGTSYAVGVGSGTDALTLSIKALGLGKGDEVIMPANSYPSVFGIALSGVTVRLSDVDANGLLDPEKLPSVISRKTKAIIPVHLYGNPCDIFRIQKILKRFTHKIYVIEDCAQSIGAGIFDRGIQKTVCSKRITGSIGDIGCFSFYPTKNLGAYGDGGMVVTNNPDINKRLRELRMYGEVSRYKSMRISGVSRLDELQAAILRVKITHLHSWTEKRRRIARNYIDHLSTNNTFHVLTNDTLLQKSNYYAVFHLLVIRLKKRDQLLEFLNEKGIGTAVHYPYPVHLTPSFKELGYKRGDFPVSEVLSNEVLSLPMYPELTRQEIMYIYHQIEKF